MEISRQYLLLRTVILQKKVAGCPCVNSDLFLINHWATNDPVQITLFLMTESAFVCNNDGDKIDKISFSFCISHSCQFFFHGVNYMIQYDSTAYSRLRTSHFSHQSRAGVFVRFLN